MAGGRSASYEGYLIKLPWLKQGLFSSVGVWEAYGRIRNRFEDYGFRIVAQNDRSMRFCAYRDRGNGECTCIYVVWIVRNGQMTYVSYGADPRFVFFWLCGKGDHLDKLRRCGQIIRSALEGY